MWLAGHSKLRAQPFSAVSKHMRLLKMPVRREDLSCCALALGAGFSVYLLDLFHLPNALQAVLGFVGRR